jgi:hypothetical protein
MYFYDASALALSGEIRRPVQVVIENQAATCLGITGGIGAAEVKDFELKGIVSFRRAFAEVASSLNPKDGTHHTSARVVVEALNILDVIFVDKVIARLTSTHYPQESEPRIVASGSHFENLSISGQHIRLEFDSDLFEKYDTMSNYEHLYQRDLFTHKNIRPPGKDVHWISLVRNISTPELLKTIRGGSGIEIPNFGRVYFGDYIIQHGRRQLSMLRVNLGSPVAGNLLIASATCNGLGGDSGTEDP